MAATGKEVRSLGKPLPAESLGVETHSCEQVLRHEKTDSPCTVALGRLETDFLFPSSLRQVFLVCLHAGPPEIQGPGHIHPHRGLSITCTPSTERRKRLGGSRGPGLGGARKPLLLSMG